MALGFICGYELAAILSSDRLPTITQLVCRLPKPVYRLVEAGVAVWWAVHLERARG